MVASRWARSFAATSGPAIERPGDLAALLSNLEPGDVLFIDEIHRLSPAVEEILYPAMEDFQLDIVVGQGPGASSIRLDLPRFTLVGATTRAGMLTSPLRDRFGWVTRLEYYPPADSKRILVACGPRDGMADRCRDAQPEIARRSRGTPRVANRLLRRVRDFAEVATAGDAVAPIDGSRFSLERLDVDEAGFDRLDRKLDADHSREVRRRPGGLDTLAAAVGEDKGTLEDVVEPYLIYQGFLDRTPRGRVATSRARTRALWRGPARPLLRFGFAACLDLVGRAAPLHEKSPYPEM